MGLKILQVSDAYYPFPGGVTEHMHNLSLHLRRRGHDVKILTGSYGRDDERFNHDVIRIGKVIVTSPRLKIFNLTQLTLTFSPSLHLQVRDFLRTNRFDIVHTHGPLAVNLPHLALHYSRYINVATFHTAFVGFNFHRIGKIFFERASRKIHLAIGVSLVALEPLRAVYRMPYKIIPNGIDTERFNPSIEPIEEIRNLGFPRILFFGRLEPRKGPRYIIEAFEYVLKEFKDAVLIVAGKGPLENELKRLALEKYGNHVVFLGFIPIEKVANLYRSVDLYTSPAIGGETFGIVLLEAMACGIPVVASDIPGYRTVIRDGENGLLTSVINPRDYASRIIEVLRDENLRKKLIQEGLKTARIYTWNKVARQVEQAYLEILERYSIF